MQGPVGEKGDVGEIGEKGPQGEKASAMPKILFYTEPDPHGLNFEMRCYFHIGFWDSTNLLCNLFCRE